MKLKPSSTTQEIVDITDPDVYDSPQAAVSGFRVRPPGSPTAVFVPYRFRAATSVEAVQLTLDPVGSALDR